MGDKFFIGEVVWPVECPPEEDEMCWPSHTTPGEFYAYELLYGDPDATAEILAVFKCAQDAELVRADRAKSGRV